MYIPYVIPYFTDIKSMSVHRSHIIVYRTGTNRVGTIIMSQALVDVNWIEVLGTASKRFKNKNLVMGLTFV